MFNVIKFLTCTINPFILGVVVGSVFGVVIIVIVKILNLFLESWLL